VGTNYDNTSSTTAAILNCYNYDGSKFYVQGNGNVGINSVTPHTPLEIYTNGGNKTLARLTNDGSDPSDNGSNLEFAQGTTANGRISNRYDTTNFWSLYLGGGSALDLVVLTSGGKAGIGVPAPATRLHVGDNSSPTVVTVGYNSTSGGYTAMRLGVSAVSSGYAYIQGINVSGTSYGDLILNEQSAGNVGIGTNSPGTKLEVNGIAKAKRHRGVVLTASVTGGGTVTTDWSSGDIQDVTASGSFTLANGTNCVNGDKFEYRIYNSSGSNITISFGTNFRFSNSIKSTDIQPIATGKTVILGCQYNTLGGVTKIDVVGYAEGF
jgi:hypothetical protein